MSTKHLEQPQNIPPWHFSMLKDVERNAAIESCIASLDLEGKTVVEIGTGAGYPAMLFARQGAKTIISCEMNPTVADIARETIAENGYSDRIQIIGKSSTQAIIDGNLPDAPDIIFTETLDCGVVNEGYAQIATDIQKIAGPQTTVLPQFVRQFGYFCQAEEVYARQHIDHIGSFDLRRMNRMFKANYHSVNPNLYKPKVLSPTIICREYVYANPTSLNPVPLNFVSTSSGVCHGLMTFFDVHFGGYVASTRSVDSHWAQAFHPLAEPFEIVEGKPYKFNFSGDGSISILLEQRQ